MKNTRARVPSARRCSWLPAELAAAVVDDDGPVAGSTTDMDVLPSMRRRPRRRFVLVARSGRCSASEVVQVLVDLPVRDPRPVALDLETLDRQERVDDLGAQRVAEDVVGLERVEGLLQRAGQAGAGVLGVGAVGVAGDGL